MNHLNSKASLDAIILDRVPKKNHKEGPNSEKFRGSQYRGVSRNGNNW